MAVYEIDAPPTTTRPPVRPPSVDALVLRGKGDPRDDIGFTTARLTRQSQILAEREVKRLRDARGSLI